MGARRAVTNKLLIQYKKGSRAEKTAILDNLVELTGWNRGHARARLQRAGEVRVVRARAPRGPLYSSRLVSALEPWGRKRRTVLDDGQVGRLREGLEDVAVPARGKGRAKAS